MRPGQGRTLNYGIDHTIKLGERDPGRGAAIFEYVTRKGEEPPDHTHKTEDEVFFVLAGSVRFHCGGEAFEVESGGMVFLPMGVEHGYTILSDEDVRLIAITYPVGNYAREGWGGYVADVEKDGTAT